MNIITKATKSKSKRQFQHGVRIGFLPEAISHDLWVDLHMIYDTVEFNKSNTVSKSYKIGLETGWWGQVGDIASQAHGEITHAYRSSGWRMGCGSNMTLNRWGNENGDKINSVSYEAGSVHAVLLKQSLERFFCNHKGISLTLLQSQIFYENLKVAVPFLTGHDL